jgi:hypothetical protein
VEGTLSTRQVRQSAPSIDEGEEVKKGRTEPKNYRWTKSGRESSSSTTRSTQCKSSRCSLLIIEVISSQRCSERKRGKRGMNSKSPLRTPSHRTAPRRHSRTRSSRTSYTASTTRCWRRRTIHWRLRCSR